MQDEYEHEELEFVGGPLDGQTRGVLVRWDEFVYPSFVIHAEEAMLRASRRLDRSKEYKRLDEDEAVRRLVEEAKNENAKNPGKTLTAAVYRRSADRKRFEFVRMMSSEEYRKRLDAESQKPAE
jgi:hypothetical protein